MEVAEELKPTVFESAQKLDEFAETNDEPVEEVCETTKSTIEVPTEPSTELDRSEILSRRKQKKLLKLAKYEEIKKQKRLRERQKQKEKRAIEAAKGIPGPNKLRKALKHNKMEKSKNTVRVAIDFDYDELMIDKDIAKCAKQLLRVYTLNRKSTMPIRLHYTSLRPNSKIENSLKRNDGYHNWDVKMTSESFLKVFDRDSIVYLTSDSDNVLEEIDPNAAYIIGGLVDHNHHKGLSLQKAEENGLKTARLPLAEYISMKTRTVLTIVHGMWRWPMVVEFKLINFVDFCVHHLFQCSRFCCEYRKGSRGKRLCLKCYLNENSNRPARGKTGRNKPMMGKWTKIRLVMTQKLKRQSHKRILKMINLRKK